MLSKIKSLSVPITELQNVHNTAGEYANRDDAKFLKRYGNPLTDKTKDVLETFINLSCKGYDDTYNYQMVYEYVHYAGLNIFKFLIFSLNNDFVLVPLKFTNIFKHTYYSVCYKVISLYSNLDNVKTVIRELSKLPIIQYCYKQTQTVTDNNNFYNTREDLEYFNTGAYRRKHFISKLENLIQTNFNFRDAEKTEELYRIWADTRKDPSHRKGMDSKLVMDSDNRNLFSLGMFVNGKLVCYSSYVIKGCIAFSLTTKTLCNCSVSFLSEYLGIDEKTAKILKRNLTKFYVIKMLEKVFRDFENVDCLYYLGSGNDKPLMLSKMELFKHHLFYEKAPVQETPFEPNIREFKDTPTALEW